MGSDTLISVSFERLYIAEYSAADGATVYIVPETFLLPQEAERLDHAFHRLQNRAALWIVKPHTSSQGRGIFITNSLESIPRNSHLVVSRYISNPYLINKHKFDIRLYVAVTSFDPLRVYVHKQGLVRFAAEPYQVGSQTLSNSFIHLTNYAINKKSARYVCNQDPGKDDIGHKWSISVSRRERVIAIVYDLSHSECHRAGPATVPAHKGTR